MMGIAADHWGVEMVMYIVTVRPLLSALVAMFIPTSDRDYAQRASDVPR